MKQPSIVVLFVAAIAPVIVVALPSTVSLSASAPSYKWSLTNPNAGQLAAFDANGGVITVASVRITNGCQSPFFVPERMPFLYDLKIRTTTGPIFCTQIARDELVAFYEAGSTHVVKIKTANGTLSESVRRPPTGPPLPRV